ncbi:MAG: GHKL domain-containing protein [Butyrivibrio sp.]|nr:GHKL domain-containing protein [Butyrivibrio sp.]
MNTFNFLNLFFSDLILIPAGIMSYLPFRNKLKHRPKRLALGMCGIIVFFSALFSFITVKFNIDKTFSFFVLLFIMYFIYKQTLIADHAKSLAVFLWTCAMMSIITNVVYGYDALVNPASNSNALNVESTFLRITLSFFILAVFWSPLYDHGSRFVDMLVIPKIWVITIPISILFMTLNLCIKPVNYSTLYVDNIFATFWVLLIGMFFIMVILTVICYNIVFEIKESAKLQEEYHILQMKEAQYLSQQSYIENTAKARHDFKHTISLLDSLAATGDIDSIREYLKDYIQNMPESEIVYYCKNNSLNALLNHYMRQCKSEKIEFICKVSIPEKEISISTIDLCNIVGNLLENAVLACRELSEEDRKIDIKILERNMSNLYIVTTNSFNGYVKQKNNAYITTRQTGSGIGLKSIKSAAELYGGSAEFRNSDTEFFSNITIPFSS